MTPDAELRQLDVAMASLLESVAELTDADARAPSLLRGWTRGHVLTHLARNAEGGVRLLEWARTGEPSYEYESWEAREAAVEAGAGRPAAELMADVRTTADAFMAAAESLAPEDWSHVVRWTAGAETPASMIVTSRLTEMMVHHVDLDVGFGFSDWPASYVADMLTRVVASMNRREPPPSATLTATDTGRAMTLGKGGGDVRGSEAELLAWLMGRSNGESLASDGRLPVIPPLF